MRKRFKIGGVERARAEAAPRPELGNEGWPSGEGDTSQDVRLPDRLLRLGDVVELTALSRPTICRAISDGRFPRPVKVGFSSRWSAQEVADYVEWLKSARPEKRCRS